MMGNEYTLIANYVTIMCIEGRLLKVRMVSIFVRFKWKISFHLRDLS